MTMTMLSPRFHVVVVVVVGVAAVRTLRGSVCLLFRDSDRGCDLHQDCHGVGDDGGGGEEGEIEVENEREREVHRHCATC